MPSNRAFTLLELLVVITIIGILSSIVIVSMSGFTDSATIAKGKAYAQQVHALLGANAVGVWNFDEGEGTTAKDLSGYNNHGTLTNFNFDSSGWTTETPTGQGYALRFDGVNDYVNLGNNPILNPKEEITLSAWIKKYSNSSGGIVFRNASYLFNMDGNRVYFNYYDTGWNNSVLSNSNLFLNKWHHVVTTYSKNTGKVKIYLDGNKDKEQEVNSNDMHSSNNNNIIGLAWTNWIFNGLIDEVRIYNTALTSTQIQSLYYAGLDNLLTKGLITQTEYQERLTSN